MTFLGKDLTDTIFEDVETTIDIPLNDEVAYKLYPKYNWVYSTSRLLDFQNIEWAPFEMGDLTYRVQEWPFSGIATGHTPLNAYGHEAGSVYIKEPVGDNLTTDVAIMKGSIKWAKHHNITDGEKHVLDELRGDIELRISALATMHFRKFAGVISVDTIGNVIVGVRLCMTADIVDQYEEDWLKRVLRIYNRRPWGK